MLNSFLIVGADGTIGAAIRMALLIEGADVWVTSRRSDSVGLTNVSVFDLSFAGELLLPIDPGSAFLCAGRSSFDECENSPETTYRVNVTGNVLLAKNLLGKGAFVVFLSSSAIFGGEMSMLDELTPSSPTTEYGRQKAEAERQLLELDASRGNVAIVRLTKVLSSNTPVVGKFIQHLEKGERFDAFSDLYISPVSLSYVVESLLEIERRRIGGVFHLSGNVELSYADFARRLATKLGVSPDLVGETSVEGSFAPVLYRPRHPALDMSLTAKTIGLAPEPIDAMLANLFADDVSIRS